MSLSRKLGSAAAAVFVFVLATVGFARADGKTLDAKPYIPPITFFIFNESPRIPAIATAVKLSLSTILL